MKRFILPVLCILIILLNQCGEKPVEQNLLLETNTINEKAVIPEVPAWLHESVVYEIYPQTFFDSNNDGIGDIPGIISKLDYVQSLGVNCIWMNPVFVSPCRDAGYDVADYYNVNPRYGTKDDIKRLFAEVHKRNMHIIIDCIFGHTSIDHPWFKESCKTDSNKYTNRYIWTNSTWKKFDMCGVVDGTTINGYCNRDGNFLTNFFWAQPALNFGYAQPDSTRPWELPITHPSVMELREEMKNFLRYWLDMGCDGFHMDMASSLVKRDTINKVAEIWQEVRAMLNKDYPDAFIVPEWCMPINAIKAGFHSDFMHWLPEYWSLFQGESWRCLNDASHSHSYFDQEGKGDITKFLPVYLKHYNATRDKGYISLVLSNLNLSRTNFKRTKKDLEVIYAFMLTMPGIPFIWYGEEIGMRQLSNIQAREGSYVPRTGTRTPMQWDNSVNAGFSKAKKEQLYFPVDTAKDAPNVASEESDSSSLLNCFKKLMSLRKSEKALINYANLSILYARTSACPFIYARSLENEVVLVILNPSNRTEKVVLQSTLNIISAKLLSGDDQKFDAINDKISIEIKPVSYSIYKILK